MEILLGAVSALLVQFYKWLAGRYGEVATKSAILLGVFGLALLWTILTKATNLVSVEAVKSFVGYVVYAVAVYEILIKNVLLVLEKKY